MPQPKKLIEVALPIKEISAESVRDKSIRHGHISTLHLWWARRPLPVCRAVVFASLAPDPLDENCPPAFQAAVELLLGRAANPGDPYKPYTEIPWTSAGDPMADNLRNRLQMFIGKFTDAMQEHLRHNRSKPAAGDQLTDDSLIKWDNKNNEAILTKARKLIFVAHNATHPGHPTPPLPEGHPPHPWPLPKGHPPHPWPLPKGEGNVTPSPSERGPGGEVRGPGGEVRGPGGEVRGPGGEVRGPGGEVRGPGGEVQQLLAEFDALYNAIKHAEHELYSLPDRHLETDTCQRLTANLHQAIEAFLDKMPNVFDPFAGGGAIPLEAARLGCRSFGNDINPVAHIIQKGSLEFPQKYGKPITYSKAEFIRLYGEDEFNRLTAEAPLSFGEGPGVRLPNRLAFDVEFYARKLLKLAKADIGHFYPADEHGNKPIAYYWARVGTCSNPSCRAEVPLLKGFYLANTKTKHVHLQPIINGNQIDFEIKKGKFEAEGWNNRGNLKCPCCGSITDVKQIKQQNINGGLGERLLAVIIDGQHGKEYRIPNQVEINVVKNIPHAERPTEKMQRNSAGGDTFSWGVSEWGQMFSPRQLLAMQSLVTKLHDLKAGLKPQESEYAQAVVTYLGILVDRVAMNLTSFGLWKPSGEFLASVFSRQAIPMVFDYPESNPFCDSTGSLMNQLDWIIRYIESEVGYCFSTQLQNASSGEKSQFAEKYITAVVTDPPYYDAIAYADLSDFFYVWLKRMLADVYPLNFATPQTPKSEECTALKHHHNDSKIEAKQHFEQKLTQIFDAIEYQTADMVSIMFAHQSTEAWTTLCNSILNARMNITGSWSMDSEREVRSIALAGAALESSVTVACKPSIKQGYGEFKVVKKAIESTVEREVGELYRLGFRGADLLTACFGQAVSEFGKYEKVEKADGSAVTVAELLDLAKESAFNALLKGFEGDDCTKFYIAWLQLYSFAETDFDDAAKFSRVGLSINVAELFSAHILIKHGSKQTLGTFQQRIEADQHLGDKADSLLINQAHRAMALYKGANRRDLLRYIAQAAAQPDGSFWRVVTALGEVLPAGSDDHQQAVGLLTNKDSLIRESKTVDQPQAEQGQLI